MSILKFPTVVKAIGIACLCCSLLLNTGCETKPGSNANSGAHDHPTIGPNGGKFLEIGDHLGSLEIVHGAEHGSIDIYVTGGDHKVADLDAAPVINLATEAGPQSLNAQAIDGSKSHWQVKSDHLKGDPHGARIRFTFGGKEYNEELPHVQVAEGNDHDHDGEGHKEGEHNHDDHNHEEGDEH